MPESASYEQVKTHYEALLSEHYTWTMGGSRAKHDVNHRLLSQLLADVLPQPKNPDADQSKNDQKQEPGGMVSVNGFENACAVDLGCGSGFQTIPLLELGFSVYAVDASDALLKELKREAAELDVGDRLRLLCGDILRFRSLLSESGGCEDGLMDAIVCMGDTLTHLGSLDEVCVLATECHAALRDGGRVVLQFRDLTQPLIGTDRFIPVRSDERTVFTCFLEWDGGEAAPDGSGCRIVVSDLVHVKKGIGAWELCKSSYVKIGLSGNHVASVLSAVGFADVATAADESGMLLVFGTKISKLK